MPRTVRSRFPAASVPFWIWIDRLQQHCAPSTPRLALSREIVHAYPTCRQTRKESSMDCELWTSILTAVHIAAEQVG